MSQYNESRAVPVRMRSLTLLTSFMTSGSASTLNASTYWSKFSASARRTSTYMWSLCTPANRKAKIVWSHHVLYIIQSINQLCSQTDRQIDKRTHKKEWKNTYTLTYLTYFMYTRQYLSPIYHATLNIFSDFSLVLSIIYIHHYFHRSPLFKIFPPSGYLQQTDSVWSLPYLSFLSPFEFSMLS